MVRPKLVDDILNGKITTGAQLRMRLDLTGTEPNENFLYWMLYISFQVRSSTSLNILEDCIRHGYFVELFRSWKVFNWLLSSQFPTERQMAIFNALCKHAPGIVVGHYIKHSSILVNPRDRNVLNVLETKVLKLAKKLSSENIDFKNKYYPKIIEIYENNRTLELAMG